MAGLTLAIVVETVVLHAWLRTRHPILAWTLAVSSLSVLVWLAGDYGALGRGAIRVEHDAIDLRIGRRASMRVPLHMLESVMRPSWRDLPATDGPESRDYRNLMKPATPNVLLTLAEPATVLLLGAVARPVRRLGLRVDDPDGFIAAIESARASITAGVTPAHSAERQR